MLRSNVTLRLCEVRPMERLAANSPLRKGDRRLTTAASRGSHGCQFGASPLFQKKRVRNVVWLFLAGVAVWILACGTATAAEPSGALRVGVFKKDITPTMPVVMSGYAMRKEQSKGVHDPLSARAIAFEQDGKRLVLVSSDLIGYYGETSASMRKAILAACQLQPSELFLTAIHTHGGPSLMLDSEKGPVNNVEYTKTLEGQLVECVQGALTHMTLAQVGVGIGFSPIGVNRRENRLDKKGMPKIELGRNPYGQTDKEVQVLKVAQAETGDLLSVVFAYATHSTAMGQTNYQITGDVHGLAEQFIEKYLDHDVIAPGFAGASGNIDPWFRVLPKFETANGWVPEPVLMGAMLGEEVVTVSNHIRNSETNCPIKTAIKTLTLPGKPKEKGAAADDAATVQLTITVGRLGDVALIGMGAEVFNEIGRAIKDASPFKHTFVITHCNGTAGYLPIRSSYEEGGYEVTSSRFCPDAAEQVVAEAGKMLRELE
jgi:neutral ceramidase